MPNKDNELEEIKIRLSSVITESELSYRELKEITGVSLAALNRYVHKTTVRISLTDVTAIAKATHTSAAWIMGWEDDETKHNEVNKKIVQTIEALDDEQKRALLEIARQMIKNK